MRRRISDIRKEVRSREKEFNRLRGDNWIRIEAQKFHCSNDHAFENLLDPPLGQSRHGSRNCRELVTFYRRRSCSSAATILLHSWDNSADEGLRRAWRYQ